MWGGALLLTFTKMRKTFSEQISVPEAVTCEVDNRTMIFKQGSNELRRQIALDVNVTVSDGKITIESKRVNKKGLAGIKALIAHINNIFNGLREKFVYELEICNVHFPMMVKVEGNKLVISNFLGEKERRFAEIVRGVNVEVKGQKIIVSGIDIEAAGQTAANIERATRVPKRDRRVFQDGIFLTSKTWRPI